MRAEQVATLRFALLGSQPLELGLRLLRLRALAESAVRLVDLEVRNVVLRVEGDRLLERSESELGLALRDEHAAKTDEALLELGIVLDGGREQLARLVELTGFARQLELVGRVGVRGSMASSCSNCAAGLGIGPENDGGRARQVDATETVVDAGRPGARVSTSGTLGVES
jgi:hypothetical protein